MQEEFFSSVEEFVAFSGGDHVINKILIANNGIGAVKAIRSIRKWAYHTFGNERMIKFVAMATPDDMRANAEFIRMADEVVNVPGGTNNNNYANVNLICEIAERMCVDAVMPLWGHASENPAFPTSLLKLKRKIVFTGPPAAPMHALGDKIGSTIIAQSAGVPTIAWNGMDLRVDYNKEGCIAPEIYEAANIKTAKQAVESANRVGYPVMIKASAGGGGKGIRQVTREEDVAAAFRQVQGEVPGSPIFIMKLADHSRHLEVQLLADKFGNAIALSGRDCSVQRRHQKIIEEGPPLIAPPDVFKRMEKSAIALAKEVGYQSLGTLEFLFHMDTHQYSFLELNPRLQVEHPVTENILGINLPACQIQVAMGIQLHRIADIRRIYGRHPRGRDTIDFDYAERIPLTGYCIATRITAENPDESFQPTSGRIREIQFRPSIDVWGYFSVNSSGLIHEFSDSQFGHLFAHGKDRESARRAMIVALKELEIRGEMRTTVEYLIRLLESEDYIHDRISTQWLDARIARQKKLKQDESKAIPPCLVVLCGGVVQGFKHFEAAREGFLENLRIGQVPAKDAIVRSENIELIYDNVKYAMQCNRSGPNSVIISNDIQSEEVTVRLMSDGGYLLNIRGTSRRVYIQNEGAGALRMIVDGSTFIFTPEYDPTCMRATVAGKIARLLVPDGAHVNAGEPFVEIEVMKMYMALKAEEPGIVHFLLSEGAVISPGDIIANIDLDHPDKVIRAEVFAGNILDFGDQSDSAAADHERGEQELPHLLYKSSRDQLEKVLNGYSLRESEIDHALATCTGALMNKLLPAYELREAMSVLEGRIDSDLYDRILTLNSDFIEDWKKDETSAKFPSGKIITAIWEFVQSNPADARAGIMTKLAAVWEICEVNFHCSEVQILVMLIKFTEKFLQVENIFDDVSYSDVINRLRKLYPGDASGTVWDLCSSHVNLEDKTTLMLKVIDIMVRIPVSVANQRPKYPSGVPLIHEVNARNLKVKLTELSRLRQSVYSRLSFAANIALMKQNTLNVDQRRTRLHESLVQALSTGDPVGCGERVQFMKSFVESNVGILDLFTESMQEDPEYQIAYLELYLRKIYQKTHDMLNLSAGHALSSDQISTIPWIKFEFRTRTFGAVSAPDAAANLTYHDLTNLSRGDSFTNMVSDSEEEAAPSSESAVFESTRYGAFAVFGSPDDFCSQFSLLLEKIPQSRAITPLKKSPLNALHAVFMKHNFTTVDEATSYIESFLVNIEESLQTRGVRRVTVVMGKVNDGSLPEHIAKIDPHVNNMMSVFTFRNTNGYREDKLYRNIEAPHAYHLDLPRLNNFSITLEEGLQTASGNVQLYRAVPNGESGPASYFARLVSFTGDEKSSEAESFFVEALDAIALALGRDSTETRPKKSKIIASNHIFLNIVAPDVVIHPDFFEGEMRRICTKYSEKMVKLNVGIVELKLACRLHADADPISIRFNITNPTGYVLNVEQYYESLSKGISVFRSVGDRKGEWDGFPVSTPYSTSHKFDTVRAEALATSDTLYVYDWPTLFEQALKSEWKQYLKARHQGKKEGGAAAAKEALPEDLFICEELVFDETGTQLRPVAREPGLNTIGMVGWLVTMKTPECRQGRQMVLIANDITFKAGSFGTGEDFFFANATQFARRLQIPRLYLAANSGARIGMAQSLKNKFSVSWSDPKDPTKGFQYLYLTPEVYDELLQKASGDVSAMPVICSGPPVTGPDGELRHVITDIIGEESDLGVENLMGSGLIAGETSRAYTDIFTLTLVIGRTVGIGAYLVRLGQRTIQKMKNSPIILTGYQALNKLLGKEIYTTNDQLGGPMIMFPNGVTHLLAETHLDTVKKALTWLSFVPASKKSHLPIRDITGVDVVDRLVEFYPKKGISYDPRHLITGVLTDDNNWESGLFDRDSFVEVLGGWAKTVVTGRARLGGIPLGIIVTENRTSEAFILADPADPTSQEKILQQAGGVWFPDSAYKTAQALRDFNHEKLPCFVFANWRGFSGGQRDMYDEVLKFGSMIVDALVEYQQPLFVYIPPFAELRGGAWVVVDHTINTDVMEFYAAEDARGGVLEATGIASIKYRDPEIKATAHRLDPVLIQLKGELDAATDRESKSKIEKQIQTREKMLMGVYRQIAVHFADLHDTPGRMQAKGVIRKQVPWAHSRKYFFWRLRRRLAECEVASTMMEIDATIPDKQTAFQKLHEWHLQSSPASSPSTDVSSPAFWDDDRKVMCWLQENKQYLREKLTELKSEVQVSLLAKQLTSILHDGEADTQRLSPEDIITKAMKTLSGSDAAKIREVFSKLP